jgi:hypothetical protein
VSRFGDLGGTAPHRIWEGVIGRVVAGERTTFVVIELEPGTVVPEHAHDNEQIGVCTPARAVPDLRRGARAQARRNLNIPSNVPHAVTAARGRRRDRDLHAAADGLGRARARRAVSAALALEHDPEMLGQ